ncbi:MAG: hypothetical protein ACQGVK_14755 [Myxococcota bacterium]
MSDPSPSASVSADAAPQDGELRVEFSAEELLAHPRVEAPLVANGVRCHGGFDEDGRYRSPRTLHRTPAIRAWQARLVADGHEVLSIDPAQIPPQFPNARQAVLLAGEGVRDPIVRALTIISIVEGFGAIIRDVKVPDLASVVVEPLDGTALAHLRSGLFEAHARDEAGHRDEGGHKQMWEAARDLAFENPRIPPDVLMRMMGRRPGRRSGDRLFPELDPDLERMLTIMAQVLVVEVFAESTFEWGKTILSDPRVSADPEGASAMVSYIQSDEKPHVGYLQTALSEIRARSLRRVDGGVVPGRDVVDGLLHRMLRQLTRQRVEEQRKEAREDLAAAARAAGRGDSLMEEFDALASSWSPPERTGFERPGSGSPARAS